MSMYGTDHEYANSRLIDTIVRRKEEPVFIYRVGAGMLVSYTLLNNFDEVKSCPIEELDLHPVPLGYCNYNKNACYLSRLPMRRDWRQGLRRGNFVSLSGAPAERIPYDVLRQVILGDFPTFTAAIEVVKNLKSIAWHRHWAVNTALQVLYKGGTRPVGTVEKGQVVLSSRHLYLTEALKESL